MGEAPTSGIPSAIVQVKLQYSIVHRCMNINANGAMDFKYLLLVNYINADGSNGYVVVNQYHHHKVHNILIITRKHEDMRCHYVTVCGI